MAGRRKPGTRVPYRLVRLPLAVIFRRIEAGQLLRGQRDLAGAAELSVYDGRGLMEV